MENSPNCKCIRCAGSIGWSKQLSHVSSTKKKVIGPIRWHHCTTRECKSCHLVMIGSNEKALILIRPKMGIYVRNYFDCGFYIPVMSASWLRLFVQNMVGWLLEFYVLATSKAISGQVLTWDSTHSWWLYSASTQGEQAAGTMTCYPIQLHYPDTEPNSPCPTLITLSVWLRSGKYKFLSYWFDSIRAWTSRACIPRSPKTRDSFGHPVWL